MAGVANKTADHRVAQGRALLNAAYKMTLPAKRVLLLCLAELNKLKTAEERLAHSGVFDICPANYRRLFATSASMAYRDVVTGVNALYGAEVKFITDDNADTELYWAVTKTKRDMDEALVTYKLRLNPDIMPFMLDLEKGFAIFNLRDCGKLTSTAQIRLYEDLSLYRSTGVWNTTLDDFARRYQLKPSTIGRPSWFNRNFLESAVKQINESTPLKVAFTNKGSMYRFTIIDTLKAEKANTDDEPAEE